MLFFSNMWLAEKLVAIELIFRTRHAPFIKLYFMFIDWVHPQFTDFNKYFQSNKIVITVLHEKVCLLFRELIQSFMDINYEMSTVLSSVDPAIRNKYLKDNQIYLCGSNAGIKTLDAVDKEFRLPEILQRCKDFLVVACT